MARIAGLSTPSPSNRCTRPRGGHRADVPEMRRRPRPTAGGDRIRLFEPSSSDSMRTVALRRIREGSDVVDPTGLDKVDLAVVTRLLDAVTGRSPVRTELWPMMQFGLLMGNTVKAVTESNTTAAVRARTEVRPAARRLGRRTAGERPGGRFRTRGSRHPHRPGGARGSDHGPEIPVPLTTGHDPPSRHPVGRPAGGLANGGPPCRPSWPPLPTEPALNELQNHLLICCPVARASPKTQTRTRPRAWSTWSLLVCGSKGDEVQRTAGMSFSSISTSCPSAGMTTRCVVPSTRSCERTTSGRLMCTV